MNKPPPVEKRKIPAWSNKTPAEKEHETNKLLETATIHNGIIRPILTPKQEEQAQAIIATFQRPQDWAQLCLPYMPRPASIILLEGEPGTGKTTLAHYLVAQICGATNTKEINDLLPKVSMADLGGMRPGDTERNIRQVFKEARALARKYERPVQLFLEECDGILFKRDLIGTDNTFMLGVIGSLLGELDTCMNHVHGALIILATNMPQILDKAVARRITDRINFTRNHIPQRQIWKAKCPPKSAIRKVMEQALPNLEALSITPAEIQQSLITIGRIWMMDKKKATTTKLIEIAKEYHQ